MSLHDPAIKNLLNDVEKFIDENAIHHVELRASENFYEIREQTTVQLKEMPNFEVQSRSVLDDFLRETEDSFTVKLFRWIDERGLTDPEVYKKAQLDRRLFSKMRSNPTYQPKKLTALALAVALELNVEDTQELLKAAGYTLTRSTKLDLIIEYFIRQQLYDLDTLNEILNYYHQPLLGSN